MILLAYETAIPSPLNLLPFKVWRGELFRGFDESIVIYVGDIGPM